MFEFLRPLFRRDPSLVRTPSSGRPRTYSAESGYVYRYSFAGFRRLKRSGEPMVEYVFSVTGGKAPETAVSVLLAEDRLAEWTRTGRELTASERFGIAKLCLKRALDAFSDPKSLKPQVIPEAETVAEIAAELDL